MPQYHTHLVTDRDFFIFFLKKSNVEAPLHQTVEPWNLKVLFVSFHAGEHTSLRHALPFLN